MGQRRTPSGKMAMPSSAALVCLHLPLLSVFSSAFRSGLSVLVSITTEVFMPRPQSLAVDLFPFLLPPGRTLCYSLDRANNSITVTLNHSESLPAQRLRRFYTFVPVAASTSHLV
jgi:hypothetical protein